MLQNGDALADIQNAAAQFAAKVTTDAEGQRHFLLASVYDLMIKREAKQISTRFKNLLYLHRHLDLAERRRTEKEDAFSALCSTCRQEMVALQDSHNFNILVWQQTGLINKVKENNGLDSTPESL